MPPFKLTRQSLCGVWPALVVPWTDDDQLDEARFRAEVQAYGGAGVNGIYTGGTTGEFYAQDDATFARLTEIVCEEGHALGLPVQIGCTALSTRVVCQRVRVAAAAGADGVQIALPFWLELKDDEVRSFMASVTRVAGELPIILYQTMRAKRRVEAELLGELAAEHPTFIGTKDTKANVAELQAMLARAPGLSIFGGEGDLLDKVRAGGRGTYSSGAMLNPRFMVELYRRCAAGRWDDALPMQQTIHRYFTEIVSPMVREEGLLDSAVDRVQRILGGVDVGLNCQGPYRRGTPEHVERLRAWCQQNAPELLPG